MQELFNKNVTNRIAVTTVDISNLAVCIEDVRRAVLTPLQSPEPPTDFHELRGRLEAVKDKLPKLYQETAVKPFLRKLDELGPRGFVEILIRDPERNSNARLMLDIAQAILQHGEGYFPLATDAFQEVVSDLYDGFLSAADRVGVKPPDLSVIPALVKWGSPESGPYTWPVDATSVFDLQAAIVSLPPIHANAGVLSWPSLPHEVCGHDILHADIGLLEELSQTVWNELNRANVGHNLPDYWASRIDETASDVLGVLNAGPAAAIGLVGYFRGMNAAFTGKAALRNIGPTDDPHPADILRGYLGAYATGLLEFSGAQEWQRVILAEADKDLASIRLENRAVDANAARESARIVAETIMKTKLRSLEHTSLSQIQNWRDRDEQITLALRSLLQTTGTPLPTLYRDGFYAAHVIAAAVTEALSKNANPEIVFQRMVTLLKMMHDANPSWGPLIVPHPGDIFRHFAYIPVIEAQKEVQLYV